jgi:hypothetical protein
VNAGATEWQRIGNQIDAATIFARADFVNVSQGFRILRASFSRRSLSLSSFAIRLTRTAMTTGCNRNPGNAGNAGNFERENKRKEFQFGLALAGRWRVERKKNKQ